MKSIEDLTEFLIREFIKKTSVEDFKKLKENINYE